MKKINILTLVLIVLAVFGASNLTAQSRTNIDALNESALDFVKSQKEYKEVVFNVTKLMTQNTFSKEKLVPTLVTLEAGKAYTVFVLVDGEILKDAQATCKVNKGAIDPPGKVTDESEIIYVPHIDINVNFDFTVKKKSEFSFFVTSAEKLPKEGAYYSIVIVEKVSTK